MTLTHGADLALQAAYRDWLDLCRMERAGTRPRDAECVAVLRTIRQLETLCTAPTLVWEVTKGAWWAETGETI